MPDPTITPQLGDAPPIALRHPPATVAGGDTDRDETLVARTVTIHRPRAQLYAYWRDFTNLPRFLPELRQVITLDERRSHWVVEGPAGRTEEWTSVVTEDVPGEVIAWRAEEGASVPNAGRVEFRDGPPGRGTEVSVVMTYEPPGGAVGKVLAKLFQREPAIQARRALRRFKQLMETGEIACAR